MQLVIYINKYITFLENGQLSHKGDQKFTRHTRQCHNNKLTDRTPVGHTTMMGSCRPCNKLKCSWCVLMIINKTSTFIGTQWDDKVCICIFNNYLSKWRWMVVDIYLGSVNIHR